MEVGKIAIEVTVTKEKLDDILETLKTLLETAKDSANILYAKWSYEIVTEPVSGAI